MIEWVDTPESSNISRFGYEAASQQLHVEFKNGSTYAYFDVPEHVFVEMRQAPSKGQFIASRIKGAFRFARQ